MTWNTLPQVRAGWDDAPLDDDLLGRLLQAAHEQVEAYAPELPAGAQVPARYAEAEALQVRALWQAHEREGDVIGFGESGYAVRVRPLGSEVRGLLRPRRGVPVIR